MGVRKRRVCVNDGATQSRCASDFTGEPTQEREEPVLRMAVQASQFRVDESNDWDDRYSLDFITCMAHGRLYRHPGIVLQSGNEKDGWGNSCVAGITPR